MSSTPDDFNGAPDEEQPHDWLFVLQFRLHCQQTKQNHCPPANLQITWTKWVSLSLLTRHVH